MTTMTTDTKITVTPAPARLALAWGLQPPPEALAAWGARAIPGPAGALDLLPDRQDCKGAQEAVDALIARLNGHDAVQPLPGDGALAEARRSWRDLVWHDGGEVEVYHDHHGVSIHAMRRGGYVHLGAWLTRLPEPEASEARVERLAAQDVVALAERCNREPRAIAETLEFGRAVRLDHLAIQPVPGGARVVACESGDYLPYGEPERRRKPRKPSHPGKGYAYRLALQAWRAGCEEVERENARAEREASLANAKAWLRAKPRVVATLGFAETPEGRRDFVPYGRLLVRAAREGWTGERLAEACEKACWASLREAAKERLARAEREAAQAEREKLDAIVRAHTAFASFDALVATDPSYHPTIRAHEDADLAVLADAFDAAVAKLGQSRRAWRGR